MTTRRDLLAGGGAIGASLALFSPAAAARQSSQQRYMSSASHAATDRITPPEGRRIRVAFMLGVANANVIDTAGPWEVFQDTELMENGAGNGEFPFELFTVAATEETVTLTGGLKIEPHYSVANAPQPDLIVVPAHRPNEETLAWIRDMSAGTDVTMSVCTGAFALAQTGLLEGLEAATHHDYWEYFERRFPDVALQRGLRFVDNGRVASAGGLTSGVDMALHIVERYFGREVAQFTADYMEYQSETWKV